MAVQHGLQRSSMGQISARRLNVQAVSRRAPAMRCRARAGMAARPATSASLGGRRLRRPRLARELSPQFSRERMRGAMSPWIRATARFERGRLVVSAMLSEVEPRGVDVKELMKQDLKSRDDLVVGRLDNGLEYVIMPNKSPPGWFEAHLEVHVGSVDEKEEEQGISHIVEHVTFLGSRKRESLLGTGCRSNAYTDFHHTVFHFYSPLHNVSSGKPLMPGVLDALTEIAFEAQFLPTRIEKERKAVLAEAQMMNTIDYRIDCQLLRYLHEENALGYRFPIGKMDQVKRWPREKIRGYWKKWYFPANATLYVVGELGPGGVEGTIELIKQHFMRIPRAYELPDGADEAAGSGEESEAADTVAPGDRVARVRHAVRPPVVHLLGVGQPSQDTLLAGVSEFRHPLLQHYLLNIFCKLPLAGMTKMLNMCDIFCIRLLISVFLLRINGRYASGDCNFISIDLDISDSAREGCAVSTFTVTSEPGDWENATKVGLEELKSLQQYGVTKGELERYREALCRDSKQFAVQSDNLPSVENLDYIMEYRANGHTVMDAQEHHEAFVAAAEMVQLEDVNRIARSYLSFATHIGREQELWQEFQDDSSKFDAIGPTWATSAVACIPSYMDTSGRSTGGGAPVHRGASMTTMEHVDVDAVDLDKVGEDDLTDVDMPENAVPFELTMDQIRTVLTDPSLAVKAPEDVEVPKYLMPLEEVEALQQEHNPSFVPPGRSPEETFPPTDEHSGITCRKLSNGIALNYRKELNEPNAAFVRLCIAGGRAVEPKEAGPSGSGVVAVGTRTLSESGTVGNWGRQQVELFCLSKLINCMMEADDESIMFDFHTAMDDGGMRGVLELIHLLLRAPVWQPEAMERAKSQYLSGYRTLQKSLERSTVDKVVGVMFGDDRRMRDPSPEEVDALTLEGMRSTVMSLMRPENMEVSVVGDIDAAELEELALKYLGTIPVPDTPQSRASSEKLHGIRALVPRSLPQEQRWVSWHLQDSDDRAYGVLAGRCPSRWGPFGELQTPAPLTAAVPPPPPRGSQQMSPEQTAVTTALRRSHPLYPSCTLALLSEVINSRLFTAVRDQLGLTYDVSCEVVTFDRVPGGYFQVNVTSTPQKIGDATWASLRVLRDIGSEFNRISEMELVRAQRSLLARHEAELKNNSYWVGLLTHMQSPTVPLKRLECLRDLTNMYKSITVSDLYDAYSHFGLQDEELFTCVSTSGKEPPAEDPLNRLLEAQKTAKAREERAAERGTKQDQANLSALWAHIANAAAEASAKGGSNDRQQ